MEVDFDGEKFSWDGLPRSAMFVSDASVAHRSLSDREALRTEFRESPGQVAVQILVDARHALTGTQLKAQFIEFGVCDGDELKTRWSRIQSFLKRSPDVVVSGERPPTYRFEKGAEPVAAKTKSISPTEALKRLASPRLPPDKRKELIAGLRKARDEGTLSVSDRAWAWALDLEGFELAPEWDEISPAALGRTSSTLLVERCDPSEPSRVKFLMRVVVDARDEEPRAHAVAKATRASPALRNDALATTVHDAVGTHGKRAAERLDRLEQLLPPIFDRELTRRLLHELTESQANAIGSRWLENQFTTRVQDPQLDDAITLSSDEQLSTLLARLAAAPLERDRLRTRVIGASLTNGPRTPVEQPTSWAGSTGIQLARLAADNRFAEALAAEPLARSVVQPALRAVLQRHNSAELLELLALLGPLEDLIEPAEFREALDLSLRESRPGTDLIAHVIGSSDELSRRDEEIERLAARIAELEQEVRSLEQEKRRLIDQRQAASDEKSGSRAEELRQLRVEAKRPIADLLEEVRKSAASPTGTSDLRNLRHRVDALAAAAGVRSAETVGELVRHDSSRHQSLGSITGSMVEVVEPTYTIDEGPGGAVLRRGLVRDPRSSGSDGS